MGFRLNGRPLAGRKEMAAQIFYIPEQPVYYEELTVEENLSLYAMPSRIPPRESCSSDRRLAYTFLQIPPHGGHPWCSAMSFPLPGRTTDFHRLDCAHAGRTKRKSGDFSPLFLLGYSCSQPFFLQKQNPHPPRGVIIISFPLENCS